VSATPSRLRGNAEVSKDGLYRYKLARIWQPALPPLYCGMLNPSTADALFDDQTTRKVIGFASRLACGSIVLWNLYAFRSKLPPDLWQAADPIGPNCDAWLDTIFAGAAADGEAKFVVAWGSLPKRATQRAGDVLVRAASHGLFPKCWGLTGDGYPVHPSRISYARPLEDFTGPAPN